MFKKEKTGNRTVLIHEVHDLWPRTLIDVGGMKKGNPFVKLLQIGENYTYKTADYVASTLEYAEPYMRKHGLSPNKFSYISNGVMEDDWEKSEELPSEKREILEELKKKNRFIVGYFGGFAISNALDRLINVAEMMDNENIVFVLIGDGTEKERLKERVRRQKLKNVLFLDPVPKACIPNLLQYFDCAYIGMEKELEIYNYGVSPTKMYDAMRAGVPVVLSMQNVLTPIEKYHCGIKCGVNNSEEIKEAIEKLYSISSEERKELGENGQRAIREHFSYEDLAKKYEQLFPENTKSVLLINHYAGSSQMGMDFRPYYLAREWSKRGYKVRILAADYSHLRRKNPQVKKSFQREEIDGLLYFWIKTHCYSGNGIKRAITMFEFVGKIYLNAKRIAKKMEPDVIITASTYPLDIFAAKKIQKYIN